MKYLPILMLLAALVSGCGARRQPAPQRLPPREEYPAPVISQAEPYTVAQQIAGQTGVLTVKITDRGFEPVAIMASLGGKVKIHLQNVSGKAHNLVVDRFGIVTRTLNPGEENYIEFTPNLKGEFPIISDAPGTPEAGYQATLRVE